MERLTNTKENRKGQEPFEHWLKDSHPLGQIKAIERLAEYEDAEEQGLLLRLPCKVGDTVYYINYYQGKVEEDTVMEFSLETYDWYVRLRQNKWVILGMFKKDFFLTRAEAESVLAEKGGAE